MQLLPRNYARLLKTNANSGIDYENVEISKLYVKI
jgi:hypothetical protein